MRGEHVLYYPSQSDVDNDTPRSLKVQRLEMDGGARYVHGTLSPIRGVQYARTVGDPFLAGANPDGIARALLSATPVADGCIFRLPTHERLDTFSTPGNVDLTATPWVQRLRCKLATDATSIVITHPGLSSTSSVHAHLEGSAARTLVPTYAAGQVTLSVSPANTTTIAIIVTIHSF
jgi:hypothetical protein